MFASTSASVYGSLRSGESLAEAERELALDVAEVDEERCRKARRGSEDGVEVDPPGDGPGRPSARLISSLAAPIFQPAGARPRRSSSRRTTWTTDGQSRVISLRGIAAAPALLAPGRDQLDDLVELVAVVSGVSRSHGTAWPGGVAP